jgi:protein SCO1/2
MRPRIYAFAAFALVLGIPLVFHARESARTERAAEHSSAASSARARGPSLHGLRSVWTTDDGRSIRFSELRDRIRILALIFTSCPRACPTLVKQLQELERRLADEKVEFVLVSIDPERDTIDVLKDYRRRMKLGDRWTLLRGSAEDVRELAAVLGFGYGTDDTSQLVHSKQVTVLGPLGELLHQQPDLSDPDRALDAIRGATRGVIR